MNTSKTYSSVLSAKLMLALANEKGYALNVTKVQKLMYIVYGYFLANEDIVIFDESPKAWPFGPVFPRTRKKVNFGKVYDKNSSEFQEIVKDENLVKVMTSIIEKYAKYSATTLSDWSHTEGGPWYKTTKEEGFNWNMPIRNDYIKEYFSEINV